MTSRKDKKENRKIHIDEKRVNWIAVLHGVL